MEICLNYKEEKTKPSEFVSFSIREYVAEIRKKDWKKCWPFGSLGDPDKYDVFASYQLVESSILCSQNCPKDHIDGSDDKPEHKEASNSIDKENFNEKEDQSQTPDMIESPGINENMCERVNNGYPNSNSYKVIYEAQNQPENSVNGSGDNDIDEAGRNGPRRKHQRFRLLSDILRNLDNVNTRFATETEDKPDDVTLDALFRKQKGVEITKMSKNKMMTDHLEEPRFEKEERSNCGSKDSDVIGRVSGSRKTRTNDMDSQVTAKRKKVRPPEENGAQSRDPGSKEKAIGMQKDHNQYREVSSREHTTESDGKEDSEMEAVMLLATRFNEEDPSSPGAKKAQLNMEVELLKGKQLSQSGQDQGFAMGISCACVQKKIRASLTHAAGNKSKDTKMYVTKVAEHRSSTALVCSINRNPADFSIPNAENVFMRGGVDV